MSTKQDDDPTATLPSAKRLLELAREAEALKNAANEANNDLEFSLQHARQYALEALAWVRYVKSDNSRQAKERAAKEQAS